MSVVINDFEVIPEPARPQATPETAPAAAPAAAPTHPEDVRRVLRRHDERCARVFAH